MFVEKIIGGVSMALFDMIYIFKNSLKNRSRFTRQGMSFILTGFIVTFAIAGCSGTGNVDLEKATPLTAEVVQTPSTPVPGTPVGNNLSLSSLMPGQVAALSSFGIVDPVGTTLLQDFDGDAIPNNKESISNYWVAEYPVVDAQVAPPITMKIMILQSTVKTNDEIISDINASDLESRKNEGSEKFHQNELAMRTVQYEREVSNSSTRSKSSTTTTNSSGGGGVTLFGFGVNANSSSSSTSGSSYSVSNSSGLRTQVFEDRPFKNNIDKAANSVKADSSQTRARQYRAEKRTKVNETSTVNADAGYVRAALYIENHSVNMPVNLSNILCSLLLETPAGTLIPVQSFKLRNADYSPFTINVYGGTQFGPYVIELTGLNTAEIENAIAQGYTPKIYIIDYDMTHVPDSNYRAFLANTYTGNNLKIIEENAKGRTALVKIFGPQLREMLRIAAFDLLPMPSNICDPNAVSPTALLKAGSSIRAMLERLACSGITVQFQDYVLDFSGVAVEPPVYSKVYYEGIKSLNGIATSAPCNRMITGTGVNGNTVSACEIKVSALTDEEIFNLGLWSVFSNGRFYKNAEYKKDAAGNILFFDVAGTTPIIKGIESLVWPGDNFDITYLKMSDITGKVKQFGTNPLETNVPLTVNTKWKKADIGNFPYYPNVKSQYLGQASIGDANLPGDKVVIDIKLDNTYYLNPSFGPAVSTGTGLLYNTFSYQYGLNTTQLFSPSEAFDFELSLGLGGTRGDWYSIINTNNVNPANPLIDCGRTWDFVNQVYHICVQLPRSSSLSATLVPNTLVSVFLRSALNNAYRESIWPRNFADVRRFTSKLAYAGKVGDLLLETESGVGTLSPGVGEAGQVLKVGTNNYTIASVASNPIEYQVELKEPLTGAQLAGSTITITSLFSTVFSGTLKFNAAAGQTFVKVVPATGALNPGLIDAGKTIAVGTELTHNLASVGVLNNVNTLTLQTALAESHSSNEEVYILGNETYQRVNMFVENGFETDWNLTYPLNTYGSLLTSLLKGTGNCVGAPYWQTQPDCQGYLQPGVISNWLGAGAYDNNWSDASNFDGLASSSLQSFDNFIVSPAGKHMSLVNHTNPVNPVDFPVSTTNANSQDMSQVAISGNLALIAWGSNDNGTNYDIRGRVVDINTGAALGAGDFLISSTNINQQLSAQIVVYGDLALVVWQSMDNGLNYDIRGRVVSISTGAALGLGDFLISSTNANMQVNPKMVVNGSRALVMWQSLDNGVDDNIRGRVVEITTGTVVGAADFLISSSNLFQQMSQQAIVFGSRALVTWQTGDGGVDFNIRGRIVDLATASVVGASDFLISSSNVGHQMNPQLGVSATGKALVSWQSLDNGVNNDIRGRVVDVVTGLPVGVADFLISTTNVSDQSSPILTVFGNKALVAWQSFDNGLDNDIRGRMVDVSTGTVIGSSDFLISSSNVNSQVGPQIAITSGGKAVVTWMSVDNGMFNVIRGRVVDLITGLVMSPVDFFVSMHITSENNQQLVIYGNKALVTWHSFNNVFNYDINASIIDLNAMFPMPYRQNHFFTSPLIERNYTVTTRLNY